MTSSFRLPFAASIAGHVAVVALMILMAERLPPILLPPPKPGIEIMLAPPPAAEPPPEPRPIPQAEPPPQVVQPEPPPPVVKAEPPPPPPMPKPAPKPPPRRPPPHPVRQLPAEPPPPAPAQAAAIPRPPAPPAPFVSPAYLSLLSAWLHSHIHYPQRALDRGEEGRAVVRFRVDRSGRVLDYAIVQSTGHPDLDAAIDQLMRGASLPPFPADMTAPDVERSVPIHFAIAR